MSRGGETSGGEGWGLAQDFEKEERGPEGLVVEAGLGLAQSLPSRKKSFRKQGQSRFVSPQDSKLDRQTEGEGSTLCDSGHPVPTPPRRS